MILLSKTHQTVEEHLSLGIGGEILLAHQSETIEAATQRQTLKGLAVDILEADPLSKIVDVLIRTMGLTLTDDSGGSSRAHAFDGRQAETDLTLVVDTKLHITLVDARTQCRNIHRLALLHELRYLTDIRETTRHQRCHIFSGIMGFQIGCLISDPRITGGVRFVESIRSKFLPVAPDLLQDLRIVSVLRALLEKLRLHRVDDGLFLLTHGLTQGITLTTSEVGQLTGEQHHLLLIDRDAVGVLQVLLHAGDIILDTRRVFLTGDELGDVIHRSRAIEGIHSDEVFEDRRMKLLQIFLHSRRLKLERSDGTTLLIELIGQVVVNRDVVKVYLLSRCLLDHLHRLFQLREGFQAEEVHLDKTSRLDDVAVVLCHVTLAVGEIRVVSR